jgi:hypothetical protein
MGAPLTPAGVVTSVPAAERLELQVVAISISDWLWYHRET